MAAINKRRAGWQSGTMALLVVFTLLWFPVGLIAGTVGVLSERTRTQGLWLIGIAVTVCALIFAIAFLRQLI